jgi:single-stranded-DNA-specific exonuclease
MNKHWIIAEADTATAAALARALDLPLPLAQTLINRGHRDADAAKRFLHPLLRQLADPFTLPDMDAAVTRIQTALAHRERIVIYGDYDVDGVTSSALLTRVLRDAGAEIKNFLPHRMDEGYGLSRDGVTRCLRECAPQLLIAVDCGTSSPAEIADLQSQGTDTIVLDHHEPPRELPKCVALVNPKIVAANLIRGGEEPRKSFATTTPFASVGLAFKLAHAFLKSNRKLDIDLREHLDLVALGTVADVVPLTGENRILVKAGLERIARTNKTGLRALLEAAKVSDNVTPYHVGFRLGPRLNAAGRLADAMAALELLLTDDDARATELASLLNDHNTERQQIEVRIVEQALELAREHTDARVLVLANPDWHIGVIGIVASRVLQEFYKPTVIVGADGKGSCRSIPGFSMVAALTECAPILTRFGGHEMAAGLSVTPENVPSLFRQLNAIAARTLTDEQLRPALHIDAVLRIADLDADFFDALEKFDPCGSANPSPLFAIRNVTVRGAPRLLNGKHLKFTVTDGEANVPAIWFGVPEGTALPPGMFDVAFAPSLDDFRGEPAVQLVVKDVRPAGEVGESR